MEELQAMEILKTAILLERRGEAFYAKVARQTENQEIGMIFDIMAKEEKEHIRILREQFGHLTETGRFKSTLLSNREEDPVAEILSESIKTGISAASFEAAAIASAIDMEKRAIAVYSERAEKSNDAEERLLYRWLAKWEEGHCRMLSDFDRVLKEKVWNDRDFWSY